MNNFEYSNDFTFLFIIIFKHCFKNVLHFRGKFRINKQVLHSLANSGLLNFTDEMFTNDFKTFEQIFFRGGDDVSIMGTWPDYTGMKTAEEFPWEAVFRMQDMSV